MFRIRLTLDLGRTEKIQEPEPMPGEGGPGGAQVEHSGDIEAGWHPMGFGLPDHSEDGG
jgi:hypothetical protein